MEDRRKREVRTQSYWNKFLATSNSIDVHQHGGNRHYSGGYHLLEGFMGCHSALTEHAWPHSKQVICESLYSWKCISAYYSVWAAIVDPRNGNLREGKSIMLLKRVMSSYFRNCTLQAQDHRVYVRSALYRN